MLMSASCRCAYGFFSALSRSFTATCQPMYSGAPDLFDVGANPRRERAARADPAAASTGEAPLRVAFALLLPRDREHAFVNARLDEVRSDDERRTADAARGVHAQHRLARAPERVGEEQLGLDDAFERVGRLADHDRVDVGERALGVFERAQCRLAQQARDRNVVAPLLVMRLADADDRTALCHHRRLHERTRGCAAAPGRRSRARARDPPNPPTIRCATSTMRIRPVAITGFAASGPPDGLTLVSAARPSASRRISSCGRERRRQLDDVERAAVVAGLARGERRRRRRREIPHSGLVHFDAMVDASNPRRPFAQLARLVAAGEHDCDRAIADRRQVVPAQRLRHVRLARATGRRRTRRAPARSGCPSRCAGSAPTTSAKSRSVALDPRRGARAPANRRATPDRRRAARGNTDRAAGPTFRPASTATTFPSRTRARCRCRRAASAPTPRTAPTRRPSRRATPRSAATHPRLRGSARTRTVRR